MTPGQTSPVQSLVSPANILFIVQLRIKLDVCREIHLYCMEVKILFYMIGYDLMSSI